MQATKRAHLERPKNKGGMAYEVLASAMRNKGWSRTVDLSTIGAAPGLKGGLVEGLVKGLVEGLAEGLGLYLAAVEAAGLEEGADVGIWSRVSPGESVGDAVEASAGL